MKPRWPTRTCVRSRPGISEFGLRPTETRTLSNTFSRSFTSLPSKQTRMPFASSLTAVPVVFSRIDWKPFSSRDDDPVESELLFAATVFRDSKSIRGFEAGIAANIVHLPHLRDLTQSA